MLDNILQKVGEINSLISDFIWGVPAIVCIIGVGLLLSIRTNFIQIRKFGLALKSTIGKIFSKKTAKSGSMSPFQAVCTALAGTVGTGNIAGVAGAIAIVGTTLNLGLLWDIAETFNGFMIIPNLIGLFALSGVVVKATKEYFNGKKGLK